MTLRPHVRRTLRTLLLATAALALPGCGDDDDPAGPDGTLAPCTGDVTVSVSAGTTPTFTWTPACTVRALLVEEDASDRWFILATGTAGIAPGVVYGTVPAGASQDEPALPLTAGVAHDVVLFRVLTTSTGTIAGMREFTP